MIYIAITKDTVYHEGDQRSRDCPGHGYPAYTESVDKITRFKTEDELRYWILQQDKYARYEIFSCNPVTVTTNISVSIK